MNECNQTYIPYQSLDVLYVAENVPLIFFFFLQDIELYNVCVFTCSYVT